MTEQFRYRLDGTELAYERKQAKGVTERAIELPIADYWVGRVAALHQRIVEVGDVTRHFWTQGKCRRIAKVIDPCGNGERIQRSSLFAAVYSKCAVLSISTLEHVDDGRYGLALENKSPLDAYQKIAAESDRFCITVPYGWEQGRLEVGPMQRHLLDLPDGIRVFVLSRTGELHWEPSETLLPYGPYANTLIVAEKGGIL